MCWVRVCEVATVVGHCLLCSHSHGPATGGIMKCAMNSWKCISCSPLPPPTLKSTFGSQRLSLSSPGPAGLRTGGGQSAELPSYAANNIAAHDHTWGPAGAFPFSLPQGGLCPLWQQQAATLWGPVLHQCGLHGMGPTGYSLHLFVLSLQKKHFKMCTKEYSIPPGVTPLVHS